MFLGVRQPSVFQKVVVDFGHLEPSGLSDDSAEHVVMMTSRCPVQDPVLNGSGETTCESLVSVDVFNAILVLVVIDIKADGSIADSCAIEPGYALHAQYGVDVIAQSFVLISSLSENR